MKVFQILSGFVYYQMKEYTTAEEARKNFAPNIQIEDAPDYVSEGWGFDETQEGDARFIQPTPPEGWLYDIATGTFYPEDGEKPTPPEREKTLEERAKDLEFVVSELQSAQADSDALNVDHEYRLTLLELGLDGEV